MNRQFQIRIKDAKAQLQAHTGAARHEPAAGQVLLQVIAASLNYRDLLTLQGAASGAARDGLVPLSDAVGTVLAVGDGVQGWQVGDRASPNFFPAWVDGRFDPAHLQEALGGGNTDGVLSQQLLVSAQSLVAPAAHLSVGADRILSHRADWILSQANVPAFEDRLWISVGLVALA